MPTGYTADVSDGKITSFRDFAWQCARAFGALMMMRDDPKEAPIPEELKPDKYYVESVQKDEVRLGELLSMPIAECEVKAADAYEQALKYNREYRAEKAEQEEERVRSRNKWLRQLRESLAAVPE